MEERWPKPKVYITLDISPEGMRKVYEALGRNLTGKMADFLGERPQDEFLESIPWNMRRVWAWEAENMNWYPWIDAGSKNNMLQAAIKDFLGLAQKTICSPGK